MKVFKFGGASVCSSPGIMNLAEIVKKENDHLVIVISAFGKTTNALEGILVAWYQGDKTRFQMVNQLKEYHLSICRELFPDGEVTLFSDLNYLFTELETKMETQPPAAFDFEYDQLVSLGEILSTKIVSFYLNSAGIPNLWTDSRSLLITDTTFRNANIDWSETATRMKDTFNPDNNRIYLTQGFIGGTIDGYATTLGREGSDYTAAIIANIMDAAEVTVWKDVPGIMTADPDEFPGPEKLDEISYQEAIELAYFGAKVIHPKTIKPLQNKNIPLYVKSFLQPEENGTAIKDKTAGKINKPVIIIKRNQVLISLIPKDFSFVIEESLSKIFYSFFKHKIRVSLIQNSAINFSLVVDNGNESLRNLMQELQNDFKVLYNDNVSLLTIRHYDSETIAKTMKNMQVLLEQRSRRNVRFVVR